MKLYQKIQPLLLLLIMTASAWAQDISDSIQLLQLSGVDLLKGIGDDVFVCLDIGTEFYKEFNPSEIARMRSMVLKLFKH